MIEGINIRPARPTDVEAAVPLILSSGPTSFNYVFTNKKNSANDFLTYAFKSKGGEFSFDNHYVLTIDDQVIGTGSVFDGKRAVSFTFYDARKIISYYKLTSMSVLRRGLQVESIIKLPKKNEISLAHIAIESAYQSKGLGQRLMKFLMQKRQSSASEKYVLDVSEENPRAKILYERMGFSTSKHHRSILSNDFGHVANHFRMEL